MPVNLDKPHLWKGDVQRSVDFYNQWFMRFAPAAFREQRTEQARIVEEALKRTDYLRDVSPDLLMTHPSVVTLLRAATAPPIARDRLVGLAYVTKNLIESMEGKGDKPPRVPPRMEKIDLTEALERIGSVIEQLADRDLLVWLDADEEPREADVRRASTVLADRLCGAAADPIIRNAQEKRQLAALRTWLEERGYRHTTSASVPSIRKMEPGTFTFWYNVPVAHGKKSLNITVDAVIMPLSRQSGQLPVLIEAKSAGDFTNTNKRRKEEAQKASQLRSEYGSDVQFILFLCGYFGTDYLGYMAAEGVDWLWEHRIDDLTEFGIRPPDEGGDFDRPKEGGDPEGPGGGIIYSDPDWNFTGVVKEREEEIGETESQRLKAQAEIDASRTGEERNKLGQFATPPALARAIAREALRLVSEDEPIRFLDPAIGTGSFFSALLDVRGARRIERATGYEIDPAYADAAVALWEAAGLRVSISDFTQVPVPCPTERFNLLLANPPYVRHHHIEEADKARLRTTVKRLFGKKASGLSGLYAYFILLSHGWLKAGGVAAWLVPTEFMDVGYGQIVREYLTQKVTLVRAHRFAAEDVQFGDALVSSAVLFFRNTPLAPEHQARLTLGGPIDAPARSVDVPVKLLATSRKWNPLFRNGCTGTSNGRGQDALTLGDLFTVKRGLATGANGFFILAPSKAAKLEIPRQFLRPVLPSPRYIKTEVVQAKSNGMPDLDKELVLLDCDLPEAEVRDGYPRLWAYLEEGVKSGISTRYLCSRRNPWYAQERRAPAPILCSYMGRSKGEGSPLRFFLNQSEAVATNVYLNLYPKPALAGRLQKEPGLIETIWRALGTISAEDLAAEGRTYGGGLHKAEPKELAALRLPGFLPRGFIDAGRQSVLAL